MVETGSAPRETLVFLHMIKSGGMSIRAALSRAYSKDAVYPGRFETDLRRDGPDAVGRRYELVMAHCNFETAARTGPRIVTVLRDPVDRIISIYNFWRERKVAPEGARDVGVRLAKELSFSDFIRCRHNRLICDLHNGMTFCLALGNNGQARERLAGLSRDRVLGLAIRNLESCDAIGLTEDLDGFASDLASRLGLRVIIRHENETRLRTVRRADISPWDMAHLRRLTWLDRALHEGVRSGRIRSRPERVADRLATHRAAPAASG